MVFAIGQPALPPTIRKPNDSGYRVIGANTGAHRMTEDGPQQSYGACGGSAPAPHVRNRARPSKRCATFRRPVGNLAHELLDVLPRNVRHLAVAKQGFDVRVDPTAVRYESTFFLSSASSNKQQTLRGSLQVIIAELGYSCGASPGCFLSSGIRTLDDLSKKTLRLVPSRVWRPRRSVAPDRKPTLAPLGRSILQSIDDHWSVPAARTEP